MPTLILTDPAILFVVLVGEAPDINRAHDGRRRQTSLSAKSETPLLASRSWLVDIAAIDKAVVETARVLPRSWCRFGGTLPLSLDNSSSLVQSMGTNDLLGAFSCTDGVGWTRRAGELHVESLICWCI